MTSIQKTPLYELHLLSGGRLVDFSGWFLPVQYDGILAEHHRTRQDVSMFDTCHMGRFWVTGPGSREGLSRLLTTDIRSMKDGQCKYGFLLREDGGILDDLITYRFSDTRWMIVVNAGPLPKDRDWIRSRLPDGVMFEDASARMAKLDVQGPNAFAKVDEALGVEAASLGYFKFKTFEFGGEAIVSRTGYTGEKGVELYVDAARIVEVWNRFIKAGVKPAGLGARDTLRLEAGLPLYGHELTEDVTPVEAAMDRYAAKPESYVGCEAVRRHREQGPGKVLVGFRIEGRQAARAGQTVLAAGRPVGMVTSGSFSPTLQCVIGVAYVERALAVPGGKIQVDTGRALLDAVVVKPPFYKEK